MQLSRTFFAHVFMWLPLVVASLIREAPVGHATLSVSWEARDHECGPDNTHEDVVLSLASVASG